MYDESMIFELVSQRHYFSDPGEVKNMRHKAIIMAHKHHFHNNAFYRDLCKSKGIGEAITPKDFPRIVIPDSVFKSYEMENPESEPLAFKKWVDRISSIQTSFVPSRAKSLEAMLSQYEKNGLFLGFSSGTTGKLTFLPRDEFTRSMIMRSYVEAVDATIKLNKGKDYFVLGTPQKTYLQVGYNGRVTAEALSPGNVYFAIKDLKSDIVRIRMRGPRTLKEKGMNQVMKRMLPRIEKNAIEGMVNALKKNKDRRVVFMAPPFFLVDTAQYIIDKGLDVKLTPDSAIASTGGFKGRKVTGRGDIDKLLMDAYGVDKGRYIDLYGMTEANSIMVECMENSVKHIPPWMEVVLFDDHMEPIEPKGKVTGYYAFLEPSSKSFPGFIMTGDKLTVDYDGCTCNRRTPVLLSIERAPRVEGRGCSGVLSKTVANG